MSLVTGYTIFGSILSGLFFGLAMAILFPKPKKDSENIEPPKDDEILVFKYPIAIYYTIQIGSVFFFSTSLLYLTQVKDDSVVVPLIFLFFFAGCLYSLFTLPAQIIVGKRLLKIESFFSPKFDKLFDLNEYKDTKIRFFTYFVFNFRDGSQFNLDLHHRPTFTNLPKTITRVENKIFEELYRFKQLLEKRKHQNHSIDKSEDLIHFENIQRYRPHPIGNVLSVVAVAAVVMFTAFLQYQKFDILKDSSKLQSLRYNDIEGLSYILTSTKKAELLSKWKNLCESKKDHHCRLASYLETLNKNHTEALNLVKKSCGSLDPHSCYSILTNENSKAPDKKMAMTFLDEYCKTPRYSKESCCNCYFEYKGEKSNASVESQNIY